MRLEALPQAVPLVLGFCILAVASELLTWVWVYSKPSFKNAQVLHSSTWPRLRSSTACRSLC